MSWKLQITQAFVTKHTYADQTKSVFTDMWNEDEENYINYHIKK